MIAPTLCQLLSISCRHLLAMVLLLISSCLPMTSMAQDTYEFDLPVGVAVSQQGHIYVADYGNYRVLVMDSVGHYVTSWGGLGSNAGQFSYPSSLAFDSQGQVYVVDRDNHRVQRFTQDGNYLGEWGSFGGGHGQFRSPTGIAISDTGIVYVADRDNQRIQRFDLEGHYLGQWGSYGNDAGQFIRPYGVAIGQNGDVYISDSELHRIQQFDASGTYLNQWGSFGTSNGQFRYPFSLAIDQQQSHVFVTDAQNNRVQVFDLAGNYVSQWGSSGPGHGQFNFPNSVTVDHNGAVYVSEAANRRVQKFDSTGLFLNAWTGPSVFPQAPVITQTEAGNGQVTVSFTIPDHGGAAISHYTIEATPPDIAPIDGTSSPMVVSGLTNGTQYTFTVAAHNSFGIGAASQPSTSVTPFNAQALTPNTTVTPINSGALTCTAPSAWGGYSQCTLTANAGFHLAGFSGTCANLPNLATSQFALGPMTSACSISAQLFEVQTSFSGTTSPSHGTAAGTATASFAGGGDTCRVDADNTAFVAAPNTLPNGQTMPHGMLQFKLIGCDATPVTVSITWPEAVQGLSKWGMASADATSPSHFEPSHLTVSGNTTTFTVQDGQLGDDDWSTNGEIVDPVGATMLAVAPEAIPVPTLGHLALILLSLTAAGLGASRLRRHPSP